MKKYKLKPKDKDPEKIILTNGRINISFISTNTINKKEVEISLIDKGSFTKFVVVRLTLEQFATALSGLYETPCKYMEIREIENVGKTMETKPLSFKMPDKVPYGKEKEIAEKIALEICPEGWKPDLYFGSQNSFTYKVLDSKTREMYANTHIRRYT